jgi:hypothetical protein
MFLSLDFINFFLIIIIIIAKQIPIKYTMLYPGISGLDGVEGSSTTIMLKL